MMGALVLGAVALTVILILGRLFVGADPKALARGLRYSGAGLLALAALALLAVDRVSLAFLVGSMAWGVFTGGHIWPGGWPYYAFRHRRSSGRANAPQHRGQTTAVRTDWIEVELDHDTGAMRGRILQGRYKGQALERLSQTAAVNFYREAAATDPETARLLEAYLDRTFGVTWRAASRDHQSETAGQGENSRNRTRANGGMSREEAYKVLGLDPGASSEEIRTAHRKLMMQNHPDHGGSSYLAAKINEAKDVLLG